MANRSTSGPSPSQGPVYGPNVEMPAGTAEQRAAAWQNVLDILRHPPEPGPGACAPGDYGTRDDWYDDRGA